MFDNEVTEDGKKEQCLKDDSEVLSAKIPQDLAPIITFILSVACIDSLSPAPSMLIFFFLPCKKTLPNFFRSNNRMWLRKYEKESVVSILKYHRKQVRSRNISTGN